MGIRSFFGCLFLMVSAASFAQTNYRTNLSGGGNWNTPSFWQVETPNGSNTWITAVASPTSAANNITIRNGDIATVTADVTIDQVTVETNAGIIINPNITVIINNDATANDLIFNPSSFLEVNGRLTLSNLAAISGLDGSADATFFTGSFYRHLWQSAQGVIPIANWDVNSTLELFGYTAAVGNINFTAASNLGQSFGNVIIDCPITAGRFINFDGTLTDIQGNLTVTRSTASSTGRVQFAAATPATMNIGGNFNITANGRTFLTQTGDLTMNIGGDFNITTTNANSSQFTVGATTTLNVLGDFNMNCFGITVFMAATGNGILNLSGDLNIVAGTLSESGISTASINFIGTDPVVGQNFIKTGGISQDINFLVDAATTLNMGVHAATGNGSFTANGNLRLGNLVGGAIQNSVAGGNIRTPVATRTFAPGITIEYNGSAAQLMGNLFPNNVNVLINNTSGVTLSTTAPITIGAANTLTINPGSFLAIAANTLTINGTVAGTGTISGGATSSLTVGGTGSLGTIAFTTGAQTINTFNLNRTAGGEVTLASNLTVSGPLNQTNGDLILSGGALTLNGAFAQASGNIVTANDPSLIIGGTGALPTNILFGGDLRLSTLTINRNAATFRTSSNLSIVNQLNLLNGTFNNLGAVAMLTGSTLTRTVGALSNPLANFGASQPFNIIYSNAATISTGPEIPSVLLDPQNNVLLNNLTKQGTGSLTLSSNLIINGTFTLSSGTFNAGTNTILMRGNLVSNATSVLTASSAQFGGTTVVSGSVTPIFGTVNVLSGGSVTPTSTFQINGNLVNNGTLNAGTGTTTFGGTTVISGASISAFNNVTVTGTLTAPSNASILVSGNWVNNGTFNPGVNGTVDFNGSSTIAGTLTTNFNHIRVTGTLTAPETLNVGGNFTDAGTFVAGDGTIVFNGTAIQNIQGASHTVFNNIDVTNTTGGPPGVRIETNKDLLGILTLSPGAIFDADGSVNTSVFTLLSTDDDPAVDASIAALSGGAAVTGDVTVQRFMSIEGGSNSPTFDNGRMYRYISSPVQVAAVSQIQPEIPVTGSFTGRSICSGCNSAQSMFLYSEPVITDINSSGANDVEDGYLDFPDVSNTEAMQTGRGYAIFIRGNIAPVSTNGHARWDVRNVINSGTVNFTPIMSYTSSGDNTSDGWNLVGNPYPSTIDWNAASGWTKTGINNTIYMRDNGSNPIVYATFNGVVGTNQGSRYIPLGQAFFVKSDGGPIDFQATEEVKAPGSPAILFRETPPENVLRIALRQGDLRDESVIHMRNDASDGFDSGADAYKLKNGAMNLSSILDNGTRLAINSFAQIDCGKTFNLEVSEVKTGMYDLKFSDFETFDAGIRIILRDAFTGSTVDIRTQTLYSFEVTADSASYGAERFSMILTPSPVADMAVTAPSKVCPQQDAKLTIQGSQKGYTYSVYLGDERINGVEGSGKDIEIVLPYQHLKSGANTVKIAAQSLICSSVTMQRQASVLVEDLQQAVIQVVDETTLVSNHSTGNTWYRNGTLLEGQTGQYLEVNKSGSYRLGVTVGGCQSFASRELLIGETTGNASVYPNPVKKGELLTLRIREENVNRVSVTNSMGIEIGTIIMDKSGSGESVEFVGTFDLNRFSSGIYFVKIKSGNKYRVVKIISL